jgi:RNA 2',3'-cyclic 3'-phosphodiesterase
VVHYLSGRGNFWTTPFMVNRFVLLSSKESVGGGPYLTEEIFPLQDASYGYAHGETETVKSFF